MVCFCRVAAPLRQNPFETGGGSSAPVFLFTSPLFSGSCVRLPAGARCCHAADTARARKGEQKSNPSIQPPSRGEAAGGCFVSV